MGGGVGGLDLTGKLNMKTETEKSLKYTRDRKMVSDIA